MINAYTALFISSLLAILGQISMKWGAGAGSLVKVLWSPWLWAGLAAYGGSTILWVYGLSQVRLGIAYAFSSLTFVGVYAASFFILKEPATPIKLVALALILAGFLILIKWG